MNNEDKEKERDEDSKMNAWLDGMELLRKMIFICMHDTTHLKLFLTFLQDYLPNFAFFIL